MRRLASTWRAFRGWISGYATTVCQSALSGRPCSAHRLTSFVRRKGVFDQEVGRSGGGSGTLSASGAPAEARARGARLQRLWAAGRGPARALERALALARRGRCAVVLRQVQLGQRAERARELRARLARPGLALPCAARPSACTHSGT
jgi:hypothetical protein